MSNPFYEEFKRVADEGSMIDDLYKTNALNTYRQGIGNAVINMRMYGLRTTNKGMQKVEEIVGAGDMFAQKTRRKQKKRVIKMTKKKKKTSQKRVRKVSRPTRYPGLKKI